MKTRLVTLLALCLSAATLVVLTGTPASAAVYSARLSQLHPMNGEVVRITGAVYPVGRALYLQKNVSGHWVKAGSTRTTSYGRYAFSVRAASTSYSYRSVAPAVRVKGRSYGTAVSQTVRVTSVASTFTYGVAATPTGQSQSGITGLTPSVATFRPARPGAVVTAQKLVNGSWHTVASGRMNTGGQAFLQVPAGSASAPATLRAFTRPASGVATKYSSPVTATYMTEKWNDEFTGSTLDTNKWQYRTQAAGGKRKCSTPVSATDNQRYHLVRVGSGALTLRIAKVQAATSACRYGIFKNSMIAATGLGGFQGQYGTYAARVKFQTGRGMHGSYWLQGPPVTGAEVDIAEYFGDGRVDSGLSSFVHYTDGHNRLSTTGGIRSISAILGANKRPSNGYHVYSVDWSPSGYVFRLDGTPILVTSSHVASAPEDMILSLLSSDYELPQLKSVTPSMTVDWVRVWQNS